MKLLFYLALSTSLSCSFPNRKNGENIDRYKEQAKRVTIIRDDWGIPHIYGKTDADAVFGLMYAQCEESFERVERNYLEKLGRLSEVEGEGYLLQDLEMRLLYDTAAAIEDYKNSPQWLKALLQAFSDGIHFYLYNHPEVKPLLLKKFEPWYPLLFTDGAYIATQTGGLQSSDMKALFGDELAGEIKTEESQTAVGSNGFAIAPSRTADKSTLLYINPHVSFYFRTEVHMVSEEGLNAYGAVTWGQFFVFQGFNEHCGWMHTSSSVDASDLYEEETVNKDGSVFYQYNDSLRPASKKTEKLFYKKEGALSQKMVTTFATHHGPVVGMRNGKWLSLKANNRSLNGLIQSWQRTKANNLDEFVKALQLQSNPSTNTIYADDKGNIAYWHGNFIPERDASLNPALPLDGSTSKTEWKKMYGLDDLVHVINPLQGFIQNCNSSPFSVSGLNTVNNKNFPIYVAPEGENFRSLYAINQLSQQRNIALDQLIGIGYSHYLPAFDSLLPPLLNDFDNLSSTHPFYSLLKEPIDSLRNWNRNTSVTSIASTIGIFWAYTILSQNIPVPNQIANDQVKTTSYILRHTTSANRLKALADIVNGLQQAFNTWKVPWGNLNRFQRISGSIQPEFDNNQQEFAVGLGSASLGSLPSYETTWYKGKQYGVAGNSFVAAVSFGPKLKAKSISTGGKSFSPSSKHFTDQVQRYIDGELKDVYFYKNDVTRHAEKIYHPGKE